MAESAPRRKDSRRIVHEHSSSGSETHPSEKGNQLRAVGVAVGLLVLSLMMTAALTVPIVVLTNVPLSSNILNSAVTSSGFLFVAGAYLLLTGRGTSYLDINRPSLSWKMVSTVIGLIIGLIAVQMAVNLVPSDVISMVDGQLTSAIQGQLIMLLVASTIVPVAEELFFRNLLQKRLAEAFPAWAAIGVAALLFTLVHIGTVGSSSGGVGIGLIQVFGSALLLGYVYHRTSDLTITIVGHAGFNAIVHAMSYLQAANLVPGGL